MIDPLPPTMPRLSRGGIIRSRPADQVMVPVGMSDLLDDWLWSPDAARWDPEAAEGDDTAPYRHFRTLILNGLVSGRSTEWQVSMGRIQNMLARLGQSAAQCAESWGKVQEQLQIAGIHREADKGPPTDVRERALWLHQHRNTGPDRDRWRIDRRRRA